MQLNCFFSFLFIPRCFTIFTMLDINILNVDVFFVLFIYIPFLLHFYLLSPQCFSLVAYHLYFNFNLYSFGYLLKSGHKVFAIPEKVHKLMEVEYCKFNCP